MRYGLSTNVYLRYLTTWHLQLMHGLILRTPATVLAICHRLQTLFRFDYVMVLDQGTVVEFGAPDALAQTPGSRLSQLLQAAAMKPEDAVQSADGLITD